MTQLKPATAAGAGYVPPITDKFVTMAHGSGGKAMHRLIEGLFLQEFRNPLLEAMDDQAVFTVDGQGPRLAFTTDSYVISPVFFPGGNIGDVAVNGTVNDLAMSGAEPLYLSVGFILEEGFPIEQLTEITKSMAAASAAAGTAIVTGDTKVVPKGKGDGLFINTAGVGVIRHPGDISARNARPGDRVIISGEIGSHGVAIMLARGGLDMEADIASDTAALHSLVAAMVQAAPGIHSLKDPTRGGVATVLNEIAQQSGVGIAIDEALVPVHEDVRGACEILGIDPLHVANEGKLVAIVPEGSAEHVLSAMRAHPLGAQSAIVGEVLQEPPGRVLVRTPYGGTRVVDMLVGDPLPRIC